jgi:acetoin utilization deacetylase AcuC-like enzyme
LIPAIPVYFHDAQLAFKPLYEWAFGEKVSHPETTSRAESILAAIEAAPDLFDRKIPTSIPLKAVRAQHNANLLTLYDTAAARLAPDETFYPMVFPQRRDGKGDPTNLHRAGSFCFDSGTPLTQNTLEAAGWSAACAQAAARAVSKGAPLAYALSRPPGHHATREAFGGYCYLNNTGIAARALRRYGRVAVVDIDYHHGNGTQSLFYRNPEVLTISVHGDPTDVFPYFAGYAAETGTGPGVGVNLNLPQPRGLDQQGYLHVLDTQVLPVVRRFDPDFLVIAAGFDTYVLDPVGDFTVPMDAYPIIGERFGQLNLPTVVVQEGGYHAPHLGRLATGFLRGLRSAHRPA